jgi:transcriptional regulator GlxA family with amidase domain
MRAANPVRQRRKEGIASRQVAVEHAEAYVRAHPATRAPVHTVCAIVGLSERGLRNAFYEVRGMSPQQWMFAARLQSVRRALNDAYEGSTTVTSVATGHGFYELGRFAARYRKAFGEAPSETLRNAGRGSAAEHQGEQKEHVYAVTNEGLSGS